MEILALFFVFLLIGAVSLVVVMLIGGVRRRQRAAEIRNWEKFNRDKTRRFIPAVVTLDELLFAGHTVPKEVMARLVEKYGKDLETFTREQVLTAWDEVEGQR